MGKKSNIYNLAFNLSGKVQKSFNKSMGTAQNELAKTSKVAGAVGKGLLVVAQIAISTAIAVGKAAYNIAQEFDNAYDKIRVGTGATGEALEGLKGSMRNVFASLPTDMDKASTAIANYNTLLGVSGEVLESLSKQAIQVEALLGDGLEEVISGSAEAFNAWNIAAEDMPGKMDYIFKVSQSTGAEFSKITDSLKTYSAQLKELGYDFDSAAALIGNIEKNGYDVSKVFSGMTIATTTLSKAGMDAAEGLEIYYKAIQMAETETEAIAMATEIFGSKSATTMAYAIRDGTLNVEDLTAALQANEETILGVSEETWDFAEKWQMLKNQMKVALEPQIMEFFEEMTDLLPSIGASMKALIPVFGTIIKAVGTVMPILSELLPSVCELLDGILEALSSIIVAITPILKLASKIIAAVTPFVNGVLKAAAKLLLSLTPSLEAILNLLMPILDIVTSILNPSVDILNTVLEPITMLLTDVLAPILNALVPIIQWVADMISESLGQSFGMVGEIINFFVEGPLSYVVNFLKYIVEFISNVFKGNWEGAWKSLANIPIAFINSIIGGFESMINFIIKAINALTSTVSKSWTWLGIPAIPAIPLVSLGRIPALAEGGITTGPTLAEIGEGSEQEAIIPLSKLADIMAGNGYGDTYNNTDNSQDTNASFNPTFNFTFNGSNLTQEEIQEIVVRAIEAWWNEKVKNDRRYAL